MPKLGLGLSLPQTRISGSSFDPDALAYLAAVEVADGQPLEAGIRAAVNDFVVGCKTDGNWDSIVTSCIMAGARTVAGALVPLRGNAPTNNNFYSGDYSRTLGLIGNDSTKVLTTGYNNSDLTSFPRDNSHISCYVTQPQTTSAGARVLVGTSFASSSALSLAHSTTTSITTRHRTSSSSSLMEAPLGFQGSSRNSSVFYSRRFTSVNGVQSANVTASSTIPSSLGIGVFGVSPSSAATSARMSFYSIGKSVTLSSLDSRVTTLMSDILSALPAPSGIPVATLSLNIDFGSGDPRNGTYTRGSSDAGLQWTNPFYSNYYSLVPSGFYYDNVTNWSFWDGDQSNPVDPTNPSTDANYIPTSGWSPSITITAA